MLFSRRTSRPAAWLIGIGALLILAASACEEGTLEDIVGGPDDTVAEEPGDGTGAAPEEPAPPDDTQPPDTQPPEGEESEFDAVTLLLVLLGVVILLVIIGAISSGSQRRAARRTTAVDDWKTRARGTYGKAKWLQENMTAEFVGQLGDVRFGRDELSKDLTTDDETVLDRWRQIERSVQETSSELYALEANPPAVEWSQIVHGVGSSLRHVNSTIAEGAKAQVAYRRAEGDHELSTADALEVKLTFDRAVREASARLGAALEEMRRIV